MRTPRHLLHIHTRGMLLFIYSSVYVGVCSGGGGQAYVLDANAKPLAAIPRLTTCFCVYSELWTGSCTCRACHRVGRTTPGTVSQCMRMAPVRSMCASRHAVALPISLVFWRRWVSVCCFFCLVVFWCACVCECVLVCIVRQASHCRGLHIFPSMTRACLVNYV